MEGLPGWVISPMPGPPPRQHKHERQCNTKHTLSHPNKVNIEWLLRRPNDIRRPRGPKVTWHLSYRWGKTPKKPHPGNLSRPGIEPGPATWQARMLPLAPQWWTFWQIIWKFIIQENPVLVSLKDIYLRTGEINFWITYTLFWPHKDMEGLLGWGIRSMAGPPPRQYKHETIHTIHAPIHSNKANMKEWLWRPNDIRGPCGLKASGYLP